MPCLLSLLPALSLTIVHAPAPKGHLTPHACFRAYMAADDNKDFTAYVACLTDEAVAVRNAYLLYLAAFAIQAKHDPAGELLRVLEQHQVAAQPLDTWFSAVNDVQKVLKSRKTAEDWKKYNETAKELSVPLKDQRGFAIDVMKVLHKKRPLRTGGEFKITRERQAGRYAELTVEFEDGPNHIVWAIRCVRGNDGWKMMALPMAAYHAPPFPPE